MTDTAAPAPVTAPAPTAPSQPTPGWKTSEAWLTFLAMLIGALPSSGLIANAPLAAKLVGMAAAVLAALGYTTNRTNLKRAHLALDLSAAPANSNKLPTAAAGVAAAALAVFVALGSVGANTATAAPIAQPKVDVIGLQCTAQDLALVKTVSDDLVGADYANAIDKRIASSGNTATGCAVLTVQTVAQAGKTSGAAALSPIELRASEMIDKYHWVAAAPGGTK
jgi:hypothetical protein